MSLKAEHLRAFCYVARHGSVTRAAKVLGLSQPAVSRQISMLQQAVGRPLYERTAQGIALTPFGETFLPHACAVARVLTQAQTFLTGEPERRAVYLNLGLSHHLVAAHTGRILRRVRATEGDVQVSVVEGYSQQLARDVTRGVLDAALVFGVQELPPSTLSVHHAGEETLVLVVKPDDPLSRDAFVPAHALNGETLILPAPVSWVNQRLQGYLASTRALPGRLLEVSGPYAVRCATLDGLGIGVSTRSFIQRDLEHGLLRAVGFEANGFLASIRWLTRAPDAYERRVFDALLRLFES